MTAQAYVGPRALAEEPFDERDELHRWQAIVSRQGDPIDDLEPLRDRLAHLATVADPQ
ncbi:hypothetical protein DSM104299_02044 [Baekduia alba]|uniref:hypothetical protein n=1 Tax=Baekduia alba TaxID=2997333 RepID=UPI00233FB342|nr:hypothetical protein [Baekduia alba]WCB93331.1 hypothetical protein DSM104299_02044 [Baekduia alba]